MRDRISGRLLDLLVLAAAALMLVFTALELREPVFTLAGVGFTTTEIAACLFILTAVLWSLFHRREAFSRYSLDVAILLFLASNFLAIYFTEDRPSALKFSLRLTYAALVYFGISRLPGRLGSYLVVTGTVTAIALAESIIGILQNFFPYVNWPWLLAPFQDAVATFGAFYDRVSATLSYPTVLSGYLELALPVVLFFGLYCVQKTSHPGRRRLFTALTLTATAIVVACDAYTYTRSGFLIVPVSLALGALLAMVYRLGRRVWVMFALASVTMFVVLGISAVLDEKMAVRLGLKEQSVRYAAEYELLDMPPVIQLDSEHAALLKIRNTGEIPWLNEGPGRFTLAYRWLSYPEGEEQKDVHYIISYLQRQIEPGEEFEIQADYETPDQPGRYLLIFDLVVHVSDVSADWFSAAGVPALVVPLEFDSTGAGRRIEIEKPVSEFETGPSSQQATPRGKFWQAAVSIWKENPVVGIGPDQFRSHYHEYISDTPPDDRHRAHNVFLETMADTGLIGLAALVYLFARAALVQWRLVADRKASQTARLASLSLLVALTAYILHSMLEYYIWQTGINFLLFTVLGLTSWLARNKEATG